jgi:hypothetical protein
MKLFLLIAAFTAVCSAQTFAGGGTFPPASGGGTGNVNTQGTPSASCATAFYDTSGTKITCLNQLFTFDSNGNLVTPGNATFGLGGGATGFATFYGAGTGDFAGIGADPSTANYVVTLPPTAPTTGQVPIYGGGTGSELVVGPTYSSGATGCTNGTQTVTFSGGGASTAAVGSITVSGGVPVGQVAIYTGGVGYSSVPTGATISTCGGTPVFTGGSLNLPMVWQNGGTGLTVIPPSGGSPISAAPTYSSGGTSCGATTPQLVTFSGGGAVSNATGNIAISGGVPTGAVTMVSNGSGYTSLPTSGTTASCTGTLTFTGGTLGYQALVSDRVIEYSSNAVPYSITLPSAAGENPGQTLCSMDVAYALGTNNIVFSPSGSDKLAGNNARTVTFTKAGSNTCFTSDGSSNWMIPTIDTMVASITGTTTNDNMLSSGAGSGSNNVSWTLIPLLGKPGTSTGCMQFGNSGSFSITKYTEICPPSLPVTANVAAQITWPLLTSTLPGVVYNTQSSAVQASIGSTTMQAALGSSTGNHAYKFDWEISLTAAGVGCLTTSTTVAVNAIFTDPATTSATQTLATVTIANAGNGTIGYVSSGAATIVSKANTAVSYSTTYTEGASCSTAPTYQLSPVLTLLW